MTIHIPHMTSIQGFEAVFGFLDCTLDTKKWLLQKNNGAPIELTKYEFRLLRLFVESAPSVLSRDHISRALNGHDWSPLDRSIDGHVARLRRKLSQATGTREKFIKTIRSSGYVLACQVRKLDQLRFDGELNGSTASASRLPHHLFAPLNIGGKVGERVGFANIDYYLGLLKDDVLVGGGRAAVNRLLLEQEDKLARNLEALDFALERAARGRATLMRLRQIRDRLNDPGGRRQADRLIANAETLQAMLDEFYRRCKQSVEG